ncbi:hypothetical protein H8E88_22410 [candidate division KSB1 bacterium]|nr:hypothetical protein [candidate division KSB1 bacterium]MBL7094907.1 hypothetical protein [candidate division KSB1 bacterium]
MRKFSIIFLLFPIVLYSQIQLPLSRQTPPEGTSNSQMMEFLNEIIAKKNIFDFEIAGKSRLQLDIPVIFFPNRNEWKKENTTVMIFAQQHGNEPSGKEALLMLIYEFYLDANFYDVKNLNLILVPMVNPDGNEIHQRRNSHKYDLNRNHVILTEPETQMLHQLFEKYKPEVTLDVHEYGYTTWLKQGYIKNFGEQFDCISNPAIPAKLKNYALNEILHPTLDLTKSRGVKANRYLITRGDLTHFVRHSTTDINDGRNSFGIQNTLSFILEGFNPLIKQESIWQRGKFQLSLIESFLKTCNQKSTIINKMVTTIRENFSKHPSDSVVIVADYTINFSNPLEITLKKTSDFKDTTIVLPDYRAEPEALKRVKRPDAYIVENPGEQLLQLVTGNFFKHKILTSNKKFRTEKFMITGRDTLHYESRSTVIPTGYYKTENTIFSAGSLLIPTNNNQANQIVQIFEAESFYGLSHYPEYKFLLKNNEYPIYRVYF